MDRTVNSYKGTFILVSDYLPVKVRETLHCYEAELSLSILGFSYADKQNYANIFRIILPGRVHEIVESVLAEAYTKFYRLI